MKKTIRSVLVTLTFALAFMGCQKKSDSTTAVATTYTYNVSGQCVSSTTGQIVPTTYCTSNGIGGYQYINGQCVSTTTGQVAPTTYCQNTGTSQYQFINGQCVSTINQQVVPASYCTQTGIGNGTAQVCDSRTTGAIYQDIRNGSQGYCYGINSICSTLQMLNTQTGQTVLCQ